MWSKFLLYLLLFVEFWDQDLSIHTNNKIPIPKSVVLLKINQMNGQRIHEKVLNPKSL